MAAAPSPELIRVELPEVSLAALAWGPEDGPLALCLHGYPDTARTWRHLGPHLAAQGWRVVAPYTRGYAPSSLARDGAYQVGALARDALALRRALARGRHAVLVGHDWGAVSAYAAAAHDPAAFERIVTMAVAPGPALLAALESPRAMLRALPLIARQLRMSWYMFFQLLPVVSERSLPSLIPKLWVNWSPGYDASEDLPDVLASLGPCERRTAALRYYRALFLPWMRQREYGREQRRVLSLPPQPLLYLHGERDGCQLVDTALRARELFAASEPVRVEIVEDAGHFLHLERPDFVNARVGGFLAEAADGVP